MAKLYDTDRKTQVAVKPTVSFLQDLNILMASTGLDASDIIRQAVHTKAEAVRTVWQLCADRSDETFEESETE